jgi:PAS domain S-box-containing protein
VEKQNTAETIKQLQSCISDLTSVLALPALWTGNEPSQIISTLLDGVVGMLRLDFAYARLGNGSPVEFLRVAQRQTPLPPPATVGDALKSWLSGDPKASPLLISNPIGEGQVNISSLRLGFNDQGDLVVAASRRRDFPTKIEKLLLQVAANQATIGLQEARVQNERKRAAEELEQKVGERTRQLTAVNEELVREITEREHAQEEQRKLAALVENSTDLIGVASLEGAALFLNPAGQRMVGLEGDDQVSGTTVFDYVAEPELERFRKEVLPTMVSDGRWEGEISLRHLQTGAAIPMLHHIFFIKEPGTDRQLGLATISRNMTARKLAEKTLLESERRFSIMFDKAALAIALSRLPDRIIVDVNEAWVKIFGFTREEVIGKTSVQLGINRDMDERAHLFAQLLQGDSVRDREITFVTKANGERLISCNMDVVTMGRDKYVLSTMHDVTELRRAEEQRRRSEAYLTEGQRLSHTGSWAWNVSNGELYWSDEHYRIFGLHPEKFELTIEAAREFIHPEDRHAANQAFEKAIGEADEFDSNFRIVRPDGTVRYVHSQGHPVFDDSGDLTEYVGTIMDTTHRELSEGALRQAHAELAHFSRVLTVGELTASIAHEVNQPLGAIVTNGNASLRFLSRDKPDLEASREAIDCMITDAMRASEVIKRIRALLKKTAPEKTPLNINEIIEEVIGLSAGQLARNQIVTRTELEPLSSVLGDRVQLQQVMLNLILNANDAMSEPGWQLRELLITSKGTAPDEITVGVSDSGTGIRIKEQAGIFDAFVTTKEDGLGLGLSISRTIIEAHGGRLWATPHNGAGTTFQFTLPAR